MVKRLSKWLVDFVFTPLTPLEQLDKARYRYIKNIGKEPNHCVFYDKRFAIECLKEMRLHAIKTNQSAVVIEPSLDYPAVLFLTDSYLKRLLSRSMYANMRMSFINEPHNKKDFFVCYKHHSNNSVTIMQLRDN